jgi:hypothetical protein
LPEATSSKQEAASRTPWTAKKFIVRKEMVPDILTRLRAPTPDADAFNEKTDKVCQEHWGGKAWSKDWSYDAACVIWINPTFNDLSDVIRQVRRKKSQAILILPDWPCLSCNNQALWDMVRSYHHYSSEAPLYRIKKDPAIPESMMKWVHGRFTSTEVRAEASSRSTR